MYRRAFFSLVRPQGFALVSLTLAVLVFFLGLLSTVAAWLDTDGGPETAAGFWTILVLPLTSLFLTVSAWVSKRAGPRAALGLLALLLTLVTAISVSFFAYRYPAPGQEPASWPGLCAVSMVVCSPFLLLAFLPLVFALPGIPEEIRQALFQERCNLASDYIWQQNGFVSVSNLARFLNISEIEAARILNFLLESGKVTGQYEPQYRMFWTKSALEQAYNDLLGLVDAHGKILLSDLAAQLNVPPELVREWVIRLTREGRFTGYAHWNDNVLYSQDVALALNELQRCPRCGGELSPAGKGVIQCEHCGTDVFLPRTRPKTRKKTAPAS